MLMLSFKCGRLRSLYPLARSSLWEEMHCVQLIKLSSHLPQDPRSVMINKWIPMDGIFFIDALEIRAGVIGNVFAKEIFARRLLINQKIWCNYFFWILNWLEGNTIIVGRDEPMIVKSDPVMCSDRNPDDTQGGAKCKQWMVNGVGQEHGWGDGVEWVWYRCLYCKHREKLTI